MKKNWAWIAVSVSMAVFFAGCGKDKKDEAKVLPPAPQSACDFSKHSVAFGTSAGVAVTDLAQVPFGKLVAKSLKYSRLSKTSGAEPSTTLIEISAPDEAHVNTDCYGSTGTMITVVSGIRERVPAAFWEYSPRSYLIPAVLTLALDADGSKVTASLDAAATGEDFGRSAAAALKTYGGWDEAKVFKQSETSYEIQWRKSQKIGIFDESVQMTVVYATDGTVEIEPVEPSEE